MPSLSSYDVLWKMSLSMPFTLWLKLAVWVELGKLWGTTRLTILSLTSMLLVQGVRMERCPLTKTLVLKTLTLAGLCALPKHTSLTITHPKSSLWANGALCGPYIVLWLYVPGLGLSRGEVGKAHLGPQLGFCLPDVWGENNGEPPLVKEFCFCHLAACCTQSKLARRSGCCHPRIPQ